MKNTDIEQLKIWVLNTNNALCSGQRSTYTNREVHNVAGLINQVSSAIADEYSFYSRELPGIAKNLFKNNGYGNHFLNPAAFGELFIIVKQITDKPVNIAFWKNIHPRIADVSQSLYCDGYYDSAANKAIKEVETALRELFCKLKNTTTEPKHVEDVINALLSENGLYQFSSGTDPNSKSYREGIHELFKASFKAYRNPVSHKNLTYTKQKAFEQITLASLMMRVLDDGLNQP